MSGVRIPKQWRLPESREERLAIIGLAALLVAGALLRLLFTFAWRPAFMGWPDAASYMDVSQGELFSSTLRPAGYPLLLKGLYALAPSLGLVVALQHLLGLVSAALLYSAVARSGAPRLLGLVPAAILALGGDFMFLEHAPISEASFIFLVSAALYAAVRALEGGRLRWAALCGLALALAASVRVVALALLVVVGLWTLLASGEELRQRLRLLAMGAAGVAAVLVPYYVAEQAAVGDTGLSRNGVWNVYGRVAPFADCSKFTPPPGTERLCEMTSRPRRPLTYQYTFNWYYSPAVRYFGNPHSATPEQTGYVAAFARAVIVGQPLSYAEEVGAGLLRYVAPESFKGYGGGPGYDELVGQQILFNRLFRRQGLGVAREHGYTDAGGFAVDHGLLEALRAYESVTRIQGALFVLIALLSLAAPLLNTGRARSAALLFALVGWTLCVVPVATVEFSVRTGLPGFGALGAAAALGGWGAARAVRRRRRSEGDGPLAEAA